MDPTEIIKHIPEAVSVAKVAAASIPFTAIVKRMLGPAADELAEMWKDQVRLYRYERQVKCVEKAEKMAQEAGFTPQAVPPKILFPLLEGASFEDNEDLHTMWAALLANAALPEKGEKVRPGFIGVLKEMASDEARLLSWVHEEVTHGPVQQGGGMFTPDALLDAYSSFGLLGARVLQDQSNFWTCVNSLEATQLIRRRFEMNAVGNESYYCLTPRGRAFVEACRPPKHKS